jgi:DNA polymerase III subunit epsilon
MGLWDWLRRDRSAGGGNPDRWVMVDVETSGLDASRDRLLAIAAIALQVDWPARRLAILPGDSFEVVLRQQEVSGRDNILLHGIGVQRQREGVPAAMALQAFRDFAGQAPLLAFHAAFDETMIGRHAQEALGEPLTSEWLDLEHLCAVTHPQVRARSLDEWMQRFGIRCALRHQAAADAWAECELLLRIWPRIARECASWREVARLAAQHRWVARA